MANKGKTTFKIKKTKVDDEGSQSVEEVRYSVHKEKTQPFLKLYIEHVGLLHKLTAGEISVLVEMLPLIDYKCQVRMLKREKEDIAAKLGFTPQTVANAITRMQQKGIITRDSYGTYYINPYLVAKGNDVDIMAVQAKLRWDDKGLHIVEKELVMKTNNSGKLGEVTIPMITNN